MHPFVAKIPVFAVLRSQAREMSNSGCDRLLQRATGAEKCLGVAGTQSAWLFARAIVLLFSGDTLRGHLIYEPTKPTKLTTPTKPAKTITISRGELLEQNMDTMRDGFATWAIDSAGCKCRKP